MKIVYTFFIKLPLIASVTHASRLRSLAAPARARAPGSGCASQSRPGISAEASRRDRRCESVPFPLASRFPFRMMRATEDRRRIAGPHRQGTRRSSSRRLSSFTKSPGRPTRRWRAGWTATPGPVRLGQEGRRSRLQAGDDPFQTAEDLRRFSADGPNMARFADIACVKTRQGRLRPAPAMDIWSRRAVG